MLIRHILDITSAADGSATAYTDTFSGKLVSIHYVADGTTPYTNTVDATITVESTGQSILTKSNIAASFDVAPRQPIHGQDGVASLFAAGGAAVQTQIALVNDRIKIILAQAGDTKTGRWYIVTE